MAEIDKRQVLIGAALLLAGTAIILGITVQAVPDIPYAVGVGAAIAVAAGTLMIGTSGDGRPV